MLLRRLAIPLSLFLALGVVSADAGAQSAADKATARDLAVEAQKALDAKDYPAAADKFGRANKLYPAPTLQLGLARAEAGRGKLVVASEHYAAVARGVPDDAPAAFKQAVVDAKKELDVLKPRIPGVLLSVSGPKEPAITLDGQAFPNAALGVRRPVDPGPHKILVSADGWLGKEHRFEATEGNVATVELTLEEAPPGAVVAPLPTGGEGEPSEGPRRDDRDTGDGGGGWMTPVGVTALVVGGAGLAVGGVFGVLAIGQHSSLEEDCGDGLCPSSSSDDLDSYRTFGTVSTVGFIAGGILAAGGITLLVLAPSETERASGPQVTPFVGAGSAGVTGRF